MGSVSGNTFLIYQGENPNQTFNIVDGTGAAYNLTGGAAVLSYKKPDGNVVNKSCTISTTTATASFDHATVAAMDGSYPFNFWCRNAAGKIVMTKSGVIKVIDTIDPEAAAPAT